MERSETRFWRHSGMPAEWADALGGPYAVTQIHYRARLVGKAQALNEADREDLEAELIVRLWRMLPRHRPEKASLRTFVSLVITNGIAEFVRRRRIDSRDFHREEAGGDDPNPENNATCSRSGRSPTCDFTQAGIDLILDVRQAIAELPPHLRAVCERLPTCSPLEISRELKITRYCLRRWTFTIRRFFRRKGLDAYLPKKPPYLPTNSRISSGVSARGC